MIHTLLLNNLSKPTQQSNNYGLSEIKIHNLL